MALEHDQDRRNEGFLAILLMCGPELQSLREIFSSIWAAWCWLPKANR
jgi:hypothetical protein